MTRSTFRPHYAPVSAEYVSKRSLERLYRDRWRAELDLRDIKTTLGMDVLSCRTPEMVVKEVWVYLPAYNLLRVLMAQTAVTARTSPRELSFKHTVPSIGTSTSVS